VGALASKASGWLPAGVGNGVGTNGGGVPAGALRWASATRTRNNSPSGPP
jgi:hypothetical protein